MKILTGKLSEFYHNEFTQAANELGVELQIIDPEKINILFGNPSKIFDNNGNEITGDAFFVRATNTHYKQYTYLAKALHSQGCIMLDSMDRFTGYAPTKEMSSIKRAIHGIGAETYSFTPEFIRNNPNKVRELLPIFVKPIDGKNNVGLKLVASLEELINYCNTNYILQRELDIVNEYRVLAYKNPNSWDGYIEDLAVTHKKTIGLKGKNPKALLKVKSSKIESLLSYIHDKCRDNSYGLIGYDIAELSDGSFKLIETNFSPQWKRSQD